MRRRNGFALLEILIALVVLSTILLRVYSSVATGIGALSRVKNNTIAMLIARGELNDFLLRNMRSSDMKDEPVSEFPNFYLSRETTRLDLGLGPFEVQLTRIVVRWKDRGREQQYRLNFFHEAK